MSMSIEKALDKIADLLTETTDDSNGSIEYSLTVIANALANGGAKELPEVTATDNGDVLTVVEGAWAKAAPSGGGCLYVTFSTEDEGTTWTADKTFAECMEAYENGSVVIAKWDYSGTLGFANLSGISGRGTEDNPFREMYFTYNEFGTGAVTANSYYFTVYSFSLNNEDAASLYKDEFTIISAS